MAYYGASCFGFRWIGAAAVILGCSFARFFVGKNFGIPGQELAAFC